MKEQTAERRPSITKEDTKKRALHIAGLLKDKKAEDVVIIDVSSASSIADFIVVSTAGSERQAQSMARHVEQSLEAKGIVALSVEGFHSARWILMDYGDIMVHIFLNEMRAYYDIEGLWVDCPRVEHKENKKAG